MSLIAACRCGARFQAPPHLAGKQVACPTCGQALVVPAAAPAPAPAQAAAPIAVGCRCGQRFAAPANLAGRQVQCPSCGQAIQVPAGTARPAIAAATSAAAGPVPVACRCGQRFNAPPNLAGRRVACPKCGSPIQVPHPGVPSAPLTANNDGFWDELKSPVKSPQELHEAETAKKEPLAPNQATSHAINRLARGATPARVYQELREKGVGEEEAQRIVEDLQEGKKRSIKGSAGTSHNSKVGMAFWGLSVPGGISLVGGIIIVALFFIRDNLEQSEIVVLIVLAVYLFVMGIGAIATSVMLQNRFKPARYIGFFFAILYLCGSPLHIICGVCALISLSSGDMTEYLNEK